VWVKHDGAVFDVAILLKKTGNVGFSEARVNSSDEEIRAVVYGFFIIIDVLHAGVGRRWRGSVAAVGRSAAIALFSISTR
jgi:hypothetical protein